MFSSMAKVVFAPTRWTQRATSWHKKNQPTNKQPQHRRVCIETLNRAATPHQRVTPSHNRKRFSMPMIIYKKKKRKTTLGPWRQLLLPIVTCVTHNTRNARG